MAIVKYLGGPNQIATFGNIPPGDINLVSTFGWIGGGVPDSIIIPDHVARALSLLIEEFKRSSRLNAMVKVMVEQAQEIEYVGSDLLSSRSLFTAGGAQLDGIGEIVGEERQGRNDTDYRTAILFRIYINVSNAEPETLITAVKFVTRASRIRYWELQPATVQMFTSGSYIPDDMVTFMESVVAGGVNIEYIACSFNALPFSFSLDDGSPNPEGGGWNELGYAPGGVEVGGQWSEGFFA